jgi:hypothetical protein
VLKAQAHDNKAMITEILDSYTAEKMNVTKERKRSSIKINVNKIPGYNGTHHYHPAFKHEHYYPINYRINDFDRVLNRINNISIITFNTPHGADIVAFNHNFVYIPKDKNDKSILIKADKNKVLEYLS